MWRWTTAPSAAATTGTGGSRRSASGGSASTARRSLRWPPPRMEDEGPIHCDVLYDWQWRSTIPKQPEKDVAMGTLEWRTLLKNLFPGCTCPPGVTACFQTLPDLLCSHPSFYTLPWTLSCNHSGSPIFSTRASVVCLLWPSVAEKKRTVSTRNGTFLPSNASLWQLVYTMHTIAPMLVSSIYCCGRNSGFINFDQTPKWRGYGWTWAVLGAGQAAWLMTLL